MMKRGFGPTFKMTIMQSTGIVCRCSQKTRRDYGRTL